MDAPHCSCRSRRRRYDGRRATCTPPATRCWCAGAHRDRRSNCGPTTPIRSWCPARCAPIPPRSTGPVGVVLLAVKATQNADGGRWLARLCDEHTIVVVLQNGVEQVEQVQPHLPVVDGDPGHRLVFGRDAARRLGAAARRGPAGAADRACRDARSPSCGAAPAARADCDPDFITAAWRKLLVNAVAGLMVLTGRRSGMFRRDDVAALARRYVAECLAVARAEGAQPGRRRRRRARSRCSVRRPTDMGTSMLADREAGRPLEWDIRNGVIIRKAAPTASRRRSATCWCRCSRRPATAPVSRSRRSDPASAAPEPCRQRANRRGVDCRG